MKNPPFVKVCGMKMPGNIRELQALPVDLMGMIFYAPSPRNVSVPIVDLRPTDIPRAGVFVDETMEGVLGKVQLYDLKVIQLHGHESVEYCDTLKLFLEKEGYPEVCLWKAFLVDRTFDFSVTETYAHVCNLFLFDNKGPAPGGNGTSYSWDILSKYFGKTPFLLSGGIGPGMEANIASFSHPSCIGLDLNSRFEKAPGEKDLAVLAQFLENIGKTERVASLRAILETA